MLANIKWVFMLIHNNREKVLWASLTFKRKVETLLAKWWKYGQKKGALRRKLIY